MSTFRGNIRFGVAGALWLAGLIAIRATASAASASPTRDPGKAAVVGTPPVVGTVTDSGGAPLANVQLYIAQLERGTTTNESGRFQFGSLPAGKYQIIAALIGYAPVRKVITVAAAGDTVRLSFTMHRTSLALEEVHVTGNATGADVRDVTQSTVQLSGQALARNLGNSLAQTLSAEPGLSVRYNGPAATAPVIRGLTGDRVLVLQNGQRTGDLSSAAPDHAVTIDPLAAQRIEVVRGPASLLYGSNALGGVVNVISTDIPSTVPTHVEGYFATQTESVNPGAAGSAAATVPLGSALALGVTGNWRGVNDTREGGGAKLLNSFVHQGGGSAGLGYVGTNVAAGVGYNTIRFNYGLPGELGDDELGSHIRGQRQEGNARSDITLGSTGVTFLRLDGTAQWYKHDEIENSGEIGTSFNLRTQTANATARTLFGRVTGAIGVSGLFKEYSSTGEEALTPAANTKSGGAFIFQDIPLLNGDSGAVPHLQVGARYDVYAIDSKAGDSKFGPARSLNFNSASGSIGLVVPLSNNFSLNGNLSRAFRAPTVEELFSNAFHEAAGTYDVGNANLKAETNNGAEVVLHASAGRVHGQLSGYYNRIDNYVTVDIIGDTTLDDASVVPLNHVGQGDATLKGGEGAVEAEVARNVVVGVMGDLVRGSLKGGEPLPFMPPARLGGSLRYDNGVFNLGGEYRHGFQQNRVPVAVSADDQSAIATDAYNLVNLSAGYTLNQYGFLHSLTVRVDNLFDVKYKDATSRIKSFAFNPGRNVSLVYKVLF